MPRSEQPTQSPGFGTRRRFVPAAAFAALAIAAAASLAGAFYAAPPAAAADKEEAPKKCVDAEAVYYGDCKDWAKPAEVDPDRVYAEISEWKQILEEKLEKSDPRYDVLLTKASRRFSDAVRGAAKDLGHDMVARKGSVRGCDSVPDISADVIKKL